VFLAIPQLQRNARNSDRANDAGRIAQAMAECVSNSNGILSNCLPTNPPNPSITATTPPPTYSSVSNPVIGNSGSGVTLDLSKIRQFTKVTLFAPGCPCSSPPDTVTANVYGGATCDSANNPVAGSTSQFAVAYLNELSAGNTTKACLSP